MKKIYEDIKKVFESETSFRILLGVGIVVVTLLIFSAGVSVGFRKASFGRAWGDNYERNFGMKFAGSMLFKDDFPNAHGAIGKILKIELPSIIVEDKDNTEKLILLKEDTRIQKMKENIKAEDLRTDDFVVIIGSPNEMGQIEAKFIRIMPLSMPNERQIIMLRN